MQKRRKRKKERKQERCKKREQGFLCVLVGEESRGEYEWRRREGLRERGGEPIPSNSHAKRAAAELDGPESGGREGLGGLRRKRRRKKRRRKGWWVAGKRQSRSWEKELDGAQNIRRAMRYRE